MTIIFDLDGTLADCEHRRHFVDPTYLDEAYWKLKTRMDGGYDAFNIKTGDKWHPNWKAFYEACDQDKPIHSTIDVLGDLFACDRDIAIWSGRCESVRGKTEKWLDEHVYKYYPDFDPQYRLPLKMRPIGDSTPDEELKEKWLDEAIANGHQIEYVFDDRPKVVRMWRRRGVFVFNCAQHDKEF